MSLCSRLQLYLLNLISEKKLNSGIWFIFPMLIYNVRLIPIEFIKIVMFISNIVVRRNSSKLWIKKKLKNLKIMSWYKHKLFDRILQNLTKQFTFSACVHRFNQHAEKNVPMLATFVTLHEHFSSRCTEPSFFSLLL